MNMQESQLPKGWKFEKVGNITKICLGLTYTPTYIDEGVPFLSVKDISQGNINFENTRFISREEFEKSPEGSKPKKGDVLFGRVGTIGCPQILNEDIEICIFVSLGFFRVNKEILFNQYIAYWMKSNLFSDQVDLNVQGSTLKNLNTGWLKEFVIPLPPLPEQQRIVSILDEAFAAIAKVKANAEQNLKNAKELFESYLQGVFEKRGEGWEEKRFDEVCILQRGFDLPTHSRNEGIHPLVSSNGITDRIDLWKVKAPGVVTGRSGTIGNVHFVEEDYWPLNTALYIKEFHGNYERFVYYFLKQFDLSKYSSGAGVPTLNRNNVHSEMICFPKSVKEQQAIVQKFDALLAETQKLEEVYRKKIADLEELKKSLLQKAFSGEL